MTIKIKERRASFSLKYQDNTGTNVIVKTSENKNRTHFFRIRIHKFFLSDSVSDPDPSTNIVTQNFFYNASHCFYMCSGICKTEKKVFQL
jgi:hypothetical protein